MTIKAEIAEVQIGPFVIDGLMSENGDFGVGLPQLTEINLVPPGRSAKQLKALWGNDFQSHLMQKWKTPINPKAVNVLTLDGFHKVVRAMDKRGNATASMFVDALFGLSLHQLFCDAFGQKFEAEDRQKWLVSRLATKHDFRPLTDQLKAHGFKEPHEYARFVWAFQTKLGIPSGSRDSISLELLSALERAQVRITTLMECGLNPWQALAKL